MTRLLGRLPGPGREVKVAPGLGEDAAAIRIGSRTLVWATDPVSLASDRIGWYAVQINANDVATMGARPKWFQACLCLPSQRGGPTPEKIFDDIALACRELKVSVVGGHTEVTAGLTDPLIMGTMAGLTPPGRNPIPTAGAKAGDAVVMVGSGGLEAAAIIAREHHARLKGRVSEQVIRRAARLLFKPGISVVAPALSALRFGPHAMHDPTEGGILAGLWEMAAAAKKGVQADRWAIPILPEVEQVCSAVGVDPLRCLASGSLLIALPKENASRLIKSYHRRGLPAAVIAHIQATPVGLFEHSTGKPLHPSPRDELSKLS